MPDIDHEEPSNDLSDVSFFDRLPSFRAPEDTLLALSGDHALAEPTYHSGLTRRVAEAWVTPISDLTCAQIRVLAGQKFGLTWLAEPIALFVVAFPRAHTNLYPGDLALAALRAFPKIREIAPIAAQKLASADFNWMDEEFSYDPALMDEARALVAAARVTYAN